MQLTHVGITVKDLKTSREFYESMGFVAGPETPLTWEGYIKNKNVFYNFPEGTSGIVQYMTSENGVAVELFQWSIPKEFEHYNMLNPGIRHIALRTDDLEGVYQKLLCNGAKILLNPCKGNIQAFMFVADPDGNEIEIAQPYEK